MQNGSSGFIAKLCLVIGCAAMSGSIPIHELLAQPSKAQASIPVRELSAPTVAAPTFKNIFNVRQVAGGKVLVNDGLGRRLVLLDGKLVNSQVVLDSVGTVKGEWYGPTATPLIAYLGDSSLFVDQEARALLLIDPSGKVVRTLASPTGARQFSWLSFSASAVDQNGNLLIRGVTGTPTRFIGDTMASSFVEEIRQPDSTFVVRSNFETRTTDTIARLKQVGGVRNMRKRAPNTRAPIETHLVISPIETLDDWAALSDGTIALVRGGDYHVDFIRPDGKRESSPKLPFDWKPFTDVEKQRIVDSTRKAIDEAPLKAGAAEGSMAARDAQTAALIGGLERTPTSAPVGERRQASGPAGMKIPLAAYEFVPFSEMPAYYPPLRMGYTKGDADGNLWILPTTSAQSKAGELVYDVVNNKGVLTERVRVPLGRAIAGFGAGGVVYLTNRDSNGVWHLERSRVLR